MKSNLSQVVFIAGLLLISQQLMAEEATKQTTYFQKIIKTAKERLGKKYADKQRVNNCKVPIDKRGSKSRPDQCSWEKTL